MWNKVTDQKDMVSFNMDVQYVKTYCMGPDSMQTVYTQRDPQSDKLLITKRVNNNDPEYRVVEWIHPTYKVVMATSTANNGHTVAWRELPNYDGTTRVFPW